jgi:nucleoside-diphosphate-sugar epimerase
MTERPTAFIAGCAGFVGRHMHARLLEFGYAVTGMDIVHGFDVRQFFRINKTRYDLVINAAAYVGGRVGIDNEADRILTYNMSIDALYFDWIRRTKPADAVYLSSSAVYPHFIQEHDGKDLIENMHHCGLPIWPESTYGLVKAFGERIAEQLNVDGETDIHVVRPFSGYGSDQDTCYPFRAFIERAKARVQEFEIWGDGTQVRDWIHIDDVIDGIIWIINLSSCRSPINLCTGIGTSMTDVVKMIINTVNTFDDMSYSPELVYVPKSPGVMRRVGNPKRFNQVYEPRITLQQGIIKALGYDTRETDESKWETSSDTIIGLLDDVTRLEG